MTEDPAEMDNLYGNSEYTGVQAIMAKELNRQRSEKRLTPKTEPWADGSARQFPFIPTP